MVSETCRSDLQKFLNTAPEPPLAASKTRQVFVFGSGRSGTTWVQDAIAESNGLGTVFEPLHPQAVRGAYEFANRYVRAEETCAELRVFLDGIIEGTNAGLWPGLRTRPDRLFPHPRTILTKRGIKDTAVQYRRTYRRWLIYRRQVGLPRVIKFIRANLLARWMQREYGYRSAIIVRHPCAVLASVCRRSGQEWNKRSIRQLLDRYLDQPKLVQDYLASVAPQLADLKSMAEVHTAIWCIENVPHLERSGHDPHLAFYENLVTRQEGAWDNLVTALQLSNVPDEQTLERPSQQASYQMGQKASAEKLVLSWQSYLSEQQQDDVHRVLEIFGVSAYSVDSAMPIPTQDFSD